ncbi:extracellular solute-binding protein [Virgisporangium ochraceum]|uniref:Sugar ABC transporter substrate-binding protein n=1 Tax=Virgisporangium ochraceum TaxID=65505 RepID=A0A8J4EAE8_9ACTN|nr:sugar ABC transporter substrate-binding protein [Virgisporangium ochraceum]GIJ67646.1 sugar ABC transporter substrate-binding protein [Virgisporangium ochraceum]
MTRLRLIASTLCLALLAGTAACGDDGDTADGPVELTFWSWTPSIEKVVDQWNAANPGTKVTFSKQAGGDDLLTKVLTAAKAGEAPDLVQAEYQVLPTLVSNNVLADISRYVGDAKSRFAEGVWGQVTLGGSQVYAVPQDSGPMMLYYRGDLFQRYGLSVPETWDEFAATATALRAKDPSKYLTTFSSNDPGWFTGLVQQAGGRWWGIDGDTWSVTIDDAATTKVANYWGDLVGRGAIDNRPMYTPEWNKALNDGTLLAWPSAIWAPGVLTGNAPDTKGKWSMAPLPQWTAGENRTGNWGGSSTGVTRDSKHKEAATKFAVWMNTDAAATTTLVRESGIYPAARDAQNGPALQQPPAFFPQQTTFYADAKAIADTAAPFVWGPNVNVTYATYKDAFGKAISQKSPFGAAVGAMQEATVADMRKSGFKLAG